MTAPLRLALFATHPIQYHAPWFRALVAEGINLHVFFSMIPDAHQQAIGFGGRFEWDVPVTEGYEWSVLSQERDQPSLGRFGGLRNGGIGPALSEFSPDAVVLTGWNAFPLLQAAFAAVRLGIPRIVRGESNGLRPRGWLKRLGHRTLMPLYDAFVSIGVTNKRFYEESGVPPGRIVDGGYFVDDVLFGAMAARYLPLRAQLRARWGVPEAATCFLFCGKLQPKKRPLDFARALARLAHAMPSAIHGLVIGSGELEPKMRALAEAEGAPMTFAGFLNQSSIGEAYAAADCLVLPSDHGETWGLVVNEAMQFGLPAIVSDQVGCGPDLVLEGETGYVFTCGDISALAKKMGQLARDTVRRREMGKRARVRIASFTPARGARALLEAVRLAQDGA